MTTTAILLCCALYLFMCGVTTAAFHSQRHFMEDGPHIFFSIVFWPITIPCIVGYFLPKYLFKRLSEFLKD